MTDKLRALTVERRADTADFPRPMSCAEADAVLIAQLRAELVEAGETIDAQRQVIDKLRGEAKALYASAYPDVTEVAWFPFSEPDQTIGDVRRVVEALRWAGNIAGTQWMYAENDEDKIVGLAVTIRSRSPLKVA